MNGRNELISQLDQWITCLGNHMGKTFHLNPEGVFAVKDEVGQEYVVDLPENESHVYFCAPIVTLSDPNSKTIDMEQILKWNLWGYETRGGTLSFEESTQRIVFHKTFAMETLDENSFVTHFFAFIDAVKHIQELWQSYKQTSPLTPTHKLQGNPDFMLKI